MIKLYDGAGGTLLGEISAVDLQFLIDQLEEESVEDVSYYINRDTVTLLRAEGASQELLAILDSAVANTGEADVRWEED